MTIFPRNDSEVNKSGDEVAAFINKIWLGKGKEVAAFNNKIWLGKRKEVAAFAAMTGWEGSIEEIPARRPESEVHKAKAMVISPFNNSLIPYLISLFNMSEASTILRHEGIFCIYACE